MKIRLCNDDSEWYCEITLDPHEWPMPLEGNWMDRPIRKWVYDHCYPGVFFASKGWILFEREEDAVAFRLTWT